MSTKPSVVGVEEVGVSSGTAQVYSDIAAATRVNWSEDQTNMMNYQADKLSDTQRNSSSVDGVFRASNSQTLDPLVSTNESVANSVDLEGSRVVLDSIGDTLVHETPSDGSLSSVLGTAPVSVEGHVSDVESDSDPATENSQSDIEARVETEDSPNASTSSDHEGREVTPSPPSSTAAPAPKPRGDRSDRRHESRADPEAEKRLTGSSKTTGRVSSTSSIE